MWRVGVEITPRKTASCCQQNESRKGNSRSVIWSLKNRITDSATTAPSHPAFSLGPTATQAVKKSWNQWWIQHTAHTRSLTWSSSLASLLCPAVRASYLFSLALALKSSITFLNRVTVKSPPSASSAIILWEGNPLLWFDMANPLCLFYLPHLSLLQLFLFSFIILNNTLLFEDCCYRNWEQWL